MLLRRLPQSCHLLRRSIALSSTAVPQLQRHSVQAISRPARGQSTSSCPSSATERFRQLAGQEAVKAAAEGGDPAQLESKLRGLAEQVCVDESSGPAGDAERGACQEELLRLAEEVLSQSSALASARRERARLKDERADILAVGFQTSGSENQEFASLVVCATAGIFAVSVHYVFFSVWAVAYWLYRRSTRSVRDQRAAVEHLEGVLARLKELDEEEAELLEELRQVLPDTIFKTTIEIPAKYEKRMQPIATGEKAPMNVGAVAIMPKGWKLAPKNRLPKPLKKEMKGLAWAPFSKEVPNAVVAGPVPGSTFKKMVLPILSPDPNSDKDMYFDRYTFAFGGNRGRGQVYPEGNLSNNNQYFAGADGKVTAIDGMKVTVTKEDGSTNTVECGAGADIVVDVGEVVSKGEPITTNPNVGGFGQDEKEMTLQDMNRVYAYCALATSIFVSQLTFVLKKKQFEKVQLAEGF